MWRGLSCEGIRLWIIVGVEGNGRGTCLPIMPMQAIDGVAMVDTALENTPTGASGSGRRGRGHF